MMNLYPKLDSLNGMYFATIPGGSGDTTLPNESITLSSPKEIPAGGEVPLNVHMNVPVDSGGYYNRMINLGIDDPAVQDGVGQVQLNFMI